MDFKCSSPGCKNKIGNSAYASDGLYFCSKCKSEHSLCALRLQVDHGKSIQEVILDARLFKTANGMADYIGVSFVTLYNWIEKYFKDSDGKGLTFQGFRREYICKSKGCHLIDIKRTSYSRSDYILKKIRNKGKCACIKSLASNLIMTNASPSDIRSILRGAPTIKKITDGVFALYPTPVKIKTCKPIKLKEISPVHVEKGIKPVKFNEI